MSALDADILVVDAVAQLLSCDADTVREQTRLKRLPGVKFGRDWVFPRAALLEALNAEAKKQVAPAPEATSAPAAPSAPPPTRLRVVPAPAPKVKRARHNPAPLPDPPAATASR